MFCIYSYIPIVYSSTFFYVEKAMGLGPQGFQGRAPGAPGPMRFPKPRPQRLKGPGKTIVFFFHDPKQLVPSSKAPPPEPPKLRESEISTEKIYIIFFFQGPMPWGSGPIWGPLHIKKNRGI